MKTQRWCDFPRLEKIVTAQCALGPDSIHGPSHWRRVERHGVWLARETAADAFVIRLFAWLHDACRENEYEDPAHGHRGAELATHLCGKEFGLEDEAFEKLIFACKYHTSHLHHEDITIGMCWDADRLDLGRVGIEPSADFMSTPQARERVRFISGALRSK